MSIYSDKMSRDELGSTINHVMGFDFLDPFDRAADREAVMDWAMDWAKKNRTDFAITVSLTGVMVNMSSIWAFEAHDGSPASRHAAFGEALCRAVLKAVEARGVNP